MSDADSTGCTRAVEADFPLLGKKRCRQPEVWTGTDTWDAKPERLCRQHWDEDLTRARGRVAALLSGGPPDAAEPATEPTYYLTCRTCGDAWGGPGYTRGVRYRHIMETAVQPMRHCRERHVGQDAAGGWRGAEAEWTAAGKPTGRVAVHTHTLDIAALLKLELERRRAAAIRNEDAIPGQYLSRPGDMQVIAELRVLEAAHAVLIGEADTTLLRGIGSAICEYTGCSSLPVFPFPVEVVRDEYIGTFRRKDLP